MVQRLCIPSLLWSIGPRCFSMAPAASTILWAGGSETDSVGDCAGCRCGRWTRSAPTWQQVPAALVVFLGPAKALALHHLECRCSPPRGHRCPLLRVLCRSCPASLSGPPPAAEKIRRPCRPAVLSGLGHGQNLSLAVTRSSLALSSSYLAKRLRLGFGCRCDRTWGRKMPMHGPLVACLHVLPSQQRCTAAFPVNEVCQWTLRCC